MERKLQRVQADLAAEQEAQRLETHGELLKAHLGGIAPGAPAAVFPDFDGLWTAYYERRMRIRELE